jgi:AcrR family transcriptional regulator
MGRRSDHSREQLRDMIVAHGHRQLSEVCFRRFSAREVAKDVGYSIGTLYNVFGDLVQLMLAINGVTLDQWSAHVRARLAGRRKNRLRILVEAYFEFAGRHRHAWEAIYDHRLPPRSPVPAFYTEKDRKSVV